MATEMESQPNQPAVFPTQLQGKLTLINAFTTSAGSKPRPWKLWITVGVAGLVILLLGFACLKWLCRSCCRHGRSEQEKGEVDGDSEETRERRERRERGEEHVMRVKCDKEIQGKKNDFL